MKPMESTIAAEAQQSTQAGVDSTEVLARHSRSFRLASLFLPEDRREDAALLYAVCRLVDDLADESDDPIAAVEQLDRLRAELAGDADARPLIEKFRTMAKRRDLDLTHMSSLIDGVQSDLGEVRIETDDELLRYCYRVAGTVGLMMCAVLGVEDPRGHRHAIDLGVAMQLTNICRDVREDAERHRVYLPAQRLEEAGLSQQQLLDGDVDRQALGEVVGDLLDLADCYYESADAGMHYIPVRARMAILVASRVYRAIGVRLRRNRCDAMAGRTVVSRPEKTWWVMVAIAAWTIISLFGGGASEHDRTLHRSIEDLSGVS